jgi:hypothetical protein
MIQTDLRGTRKIQIHLVIRNTIHRLTEKNLIISNKMAIIM